MAYIIPSDITQLAFSGVHKPEIETLEYLRDALPNDYKVFHGVHWSREYNAWSHFGEIDFVILHCSGKVLFIEQKNGPLLETTRGLVKKYGKQEKNVADQIHRSKDKVLEKFQFQHGNNVRLDVDYLIYCPDYEVINVNAVGLNLERVVDSKVSDKLADKIQQLFLSAMNIGKENYQIIEAFFHQTFEIVPSIHTHIKSQSRQYIRQGGALADILTNLEMEPFRLRIIGSAGCGKSLFASQFMRKESDAGRKVLLLCYNRPLAEQLKSANEYGQTINTFYGLCDHFLSSRGFQLDYMSMTTNPGFWAEVLNQVVEEDINENEQFDTIIVDEGQDFEQDWYEIIRLFAKDKANILWLEDADQNIYSKKSVSLTNFVTYRSNVNYRSPQSIASFIQDHLSIEFKSMNSLPGLGVSVHEYDSEKQQIKKVGAIVSELVRQGFKTDDIAIITMQSLSKSAFNNIDKVGSFSLMKGAGVNSDSGEWVIPEGQILIDSVYRLKGLERPAVILVDINALNQNSYKLNKLLYCAMTRATVKLDILLDGNSNLFKAS